VLENLLGHRTVNIDLNLNNEFVEDEIREQERRKHRNITGGYISLFPDFTGQS
jgi:hypothetical protein